MPGGIEVEHFRCASARGRDARRAATIAQGQLSGPLRGPQEGRERRGLRAHFAPVAAAEAAVGARLPPAVVAADDGPRNGESLDPDLRAGLLDEPGCRVREKRRQGVQPSAARYADLPLDLGIERLEVRERDGPALEVLAAHAEEVAAHVHRAATDAAGDEPLRTALAAA